MNRILLYLWIPIFLGQGCQPKKPTPVQLSKKEMEKLIIDSQRAYLKEEDKMMDNYAKKNLWKEVIISDTGIRYWIYHRGNGESYSKIKEQIKTPVQVAIKYQSKLMDNTPCYSASAKKPLIFVVGESQAISGLHELVTYLRQGDRVKAIIPPRLAYGLGGDLNKVPPNSPVVYDLEILAWNY